MRPQILTRRPFGLFRKIDFNYSARGMRSLDEPLRERILAVLRRQQRRAALEDFLLGLMFLFAGIFLTVGSLWATIMAIAYVLTALGGRRMHPALVGIIGFSIFALLMVWRRRRIVEEANPDEWSRFGDSSSDETVQVAMDAAVTFFFIGPHCIALFWQFARRAGIILQADLTELSEPIEIALVRRRKVRAHDLPGIDLEEFLAKAEWVPGIARLYREPIGFVLTAEFRKQLLGVRPEPPPAREEPLPPNYDELDEEIRWALLTMGLPPNPTRKQINTAYRELAKKVHPDVQSNETTRHENEERMKDLNLAYEILRQS